MDEPPAIETAPFDALDEALRDGGPGAAIDRLLAHLEAHGPPRALLDAMLLKARHDLGLPPILDGGLAELPEPQRARYEDRYVAAIRHVGSKLLDEGDVVGAWPYFRLLGESGPIQRALEDYRPAEADEGLGPIVDVAFNQGAHPRRGFELILEHYGICSAITAFEHLPPDEAVRVPCVERLVRTLHEQLTNSLRADLARRGQVVPREGTPIAQLVAGRPWLFADDAYHIDVSHLGSVVRLAPLATDPEALRLALDLTAYGRELSPRYRYEGDPPFEDLYEDHAVYLGALGGEGVDAAAAHFRGKLPPPDPDGAPAATATVPAQVLVRLLERADRLDEAIAVATEHLAGVPDGALFCSPLAVLCRRAGRLDHLAAQARRRGDLVPYAAALLQQNPPSVS
jgi:hypothetical protein